MLKREEITRERVDRLIAEANKLGDFPFLSHESREENRRQFLKHWPATDDLWIFGYGSLIWNPAFYFEERVKARIFGFHRRFCLRLTIGRGSPEKPGLMLALDRGGSCTGIAFRIAADKIESETTILWMREMISGAYRPHWLNLHTESGTLKGFTFVANHQHERYMEQLDLAETARRIACGHGQLGSCFDYLAHTITGLNEIGIKDSYLNRLQRILLQN